MSEAAPDRTRRGLLTLLSSLPGFGKARQGGDAFELVPRFREGEAFAYAFEHQVRQGDQVQRAYRLAIRVVVLEASDRYTLVRWKPGAAKIVDVVPAMRGLLEAGLRMMEDVELDLLLDPQGRVAALDNTDEVQQCCLALVDRWAEVSSNQPGQAPQAAAVRAMLQQAFSSPQAVELSALKEPQLLWGAMGRRYGAGEVLEEAMTLVNPLTGAPVPALARLRVRGADRLAHRAELGWLMVAEASGLKRSAEAIVQDVAASAGRPGAAPPLPAVDIDERGTYVIDTRTAWPLQVNHARRIAVGGQVRIDRTSFRKVELA